MPGGDDKIKTLYDAASQKYELGTYEEFSAKLKDPAKRKAFYESASGDFDLGDYATFETKVSGTTAVPDLKKKATINPVPSVPSISENGTSGSGTGNLALSENSDYNWVNSFSGEKNVSGMTASTVPAFANQVQPFNKNPPKENIITTTTPLGRKEKIDLVKFKDTPERFDKIQKEWETKEIISAFDSYNQKQPAENSTKNPLGDAGQFYLDYLKANKPDEYQYQISKFGSVQNDPLEKEKQQAELINKGLTLRAQALDGKYQEVKNVRNVVAGDLANLDEKEKQLNDVTSKLQKHEEDLKFFEGTLNIDRSSPEIARQQTMQYYQQKFPEKYADYTNLVEQYQPLKADVDGILAQPAMQQYNQQIATLLKDYNSNYQVAKDFIDNLNPANVVSNPEERSAIQKKFSALVDKNYEDHINQKVADENYNDMPYIPQQAKAMYNNIGRSIDNMLVGMTYLPKMFSSSKDYNWTDSFYDASKNYFDDVDKNTFDLPIKADKPVFDTKTGEWNLSYLPTKVAGTGATIAMMALGGELGAGLGELAAAGKVGSYAGSFATSYVMTSENAYKEAKDAGMTEKDATDFSIKTGVQQSMIEMLFPEEKLFNSVTLKSSAKNYANAISKGVSKNEALAQTFKNMLKNSGKEVTEEELGQLTDFANKYFANKSSGVDFDLSNSQNDFMETALVTFATTLPLSIIGGKTSRSRMQQEAFYMASQQVDKMAKRIDQMVKEGQMTPETAEITKQKIEIAAEEVKKIPSNIPQNKKIAILPDLVEKRLMEEQKKSSDKVFHEQQDAEIKTKEEQIKNDLNLKEEDVSTERPVSQNVEPIIPQNVQKENQGNQKTNETQLLNEQTPGVTPEVTPGTSDVVNEEDLTNLSRTAEEHRKAGKYTKDSVEYTRQAPLKTPAGKETTVKFSQSISYPGEYTVVEADELQPSHISSARNPNFFIPEAQPKERTDIASKKASDQIAANPNFQEISEGTTAYIGAPVINGRGEVIQGNNRAEGLKKHYGQNQTGYKDSLVENAEKFGLNAEEISNMKSPVLVRKINTDDKTAIQLGNYDVKDIESGGKRRLDVQQLANRLPHEVKKTLVSVVENMQEGQTLNKIIRDNFDKILKTLSPKYINDAQASNMVDKATGEPKTAGLQDVESLYKEMLFVGGAPGLNETFESFPSTVKEGISKSLNNILSVQEENSLLEDIQNSMLAMNEFYQSGIDSFDDWSGQADMFNESKTPSEIYTPVEMAIAKKMVEAKNQKEVKEVFSKYKQLTEGTEGDMFDQGIAAVSKPEAIKELFGVKYEPVKKVTNEQASDATKTETVSTEATTTNTQAGTGVVTKEVSGEKSTGGNESVKNEVKPPVPENKPVPKVKPTVTPAAEENEGPKRAHTIRLEDNEKTHKSILAGMTKEEKTYNPVKINETAEYINKVLDKYAEENKLVDLANSIAADPANSPFSTVEQSIANYFIGERMLELSEQKENEFIKDSLLETATRLHGLSGIAATNAAQLLALRAVLATRLPSSTLALRRRVQAEIFATQEEQMTDKQKETVKETTMTLNELLQTEEAQKEIEKAVGKKVEEMAEKRIGKERSTKVKSVLGSLKIDVKDC